MTPTECKSETLSKEYFCRARTFRSSSISHRLISVRINDEERVGYRKEQLKGQLSEMDFDHVLRHMQDSDVTSRIVYSVADAENGISIQMTAT